MDRTVDVSTLDPDYVNENNAGRIVGLVGTFHFLALGFVCLRIYARAALVKAFSIDDGLIIVVVALALGSWICLVLQIPYGLGRHSIIIPTEDRIKFERIAFWKTVFSDGVALGLLRISMAISLLRLKRDLNWYRWSLFGVMGTSLSFCECPASYADHARLCCRILYSGNCVAVRVLHALFRVVGVPMDEPL